MMIELKTSLRQQAAETQTVWSGQLVKLSLTCQRDQKSISKAVLDATWQHFVVVLAESIFGRLSKSRVQYYLCDKLSCSPDLL